MARCRLIILLFFLSASSLAQTGSISGRVTDAVTGAGIANASVFLNNATKGSQTDAKGYFIISNIKAGEYDLIASMIGYALFSKHLSINGNQQDTEIKLTPKPVDLQEVIVKPDQNRASNFEQFKINFIGQGANAALTKIINPEEVRLFYDTDNNVLEASSDRYLIIENKALGYRLKYLLTEFRKNYKSGFRYYAGPVSFEEMKGSKAQLKRWKENRLEAYLGSDMHLYRSLIKDQLKSNGFELHTLVRKENLLRPSDSLIKEKLKLFGPVNIKTINSNDSLKYWANKSALPKINQILIKDTLKTADVMKHTDQPGIFELSFKENLYVKYSTGKAGNAMPSGNYFTTKPDNSANLLITIVTLQRPSAYFDSNGIITDPQSVFYEGGKWGNGVANMLPNDYEP